MGCAGCVGTYTVNLDFTSIRAVPDHCPACGASGLVAIGEGDVTRFLCRACERCWRFELGWATPVDAETGQALQEPAFSSRLPI